MCIIKQNQFLESFWHIVTQALEHWTILAPSFFCVILTFFNICVQPTMKNNNGKKQMVVNVPPLQGNPFVFRAKLMFSFKNRYSANLKCYMNCIFATYLGNKVNKSKNSTLDSFNSTKMVISHDKKNKTHSVIGQVYGR